MRICEGMGCGMTAFTGRGSLGDMAVRSMLLGLMTSTDII